MIEKMERDDIPLELIERCPPGGVVVHIDDTVSSIVLYHPDTKTKVKEFVTNTEERVGIILDRMVTQLKKEIASRQ